MNKKRGEGMALVFVVLAGKMDDGEENIKYCNDTDSMEGAMELIEKNQLYTYPICRIEVTGFKAA